VRGSRYVSRNGDPPRQYREDSSNAIFASDVAAPVVRLRGGPLQNGVLVFHEREQRRRECIAAIDRAENGVIRRGIEVLEEQVRRAEDMFMQMS
jgi:hypothetical protein